MRSAMPGPHATVDLAPGLLPGTSGFEEQGIHLSPAEDEALHAARQGTGLLMQLVERGLAQSTEAGRGETP